jgi:pentatricopeptide repeat protein
MLYADREYRKLKREKLTGTVAMYTALVNMYNANSKPQESTAVLQDMIKADFQPNLWLIMSVLTVRSELGSILKCTSAQSLAPSQVAIERMDTETLRLLTQWCVDLNGKLDRGSCQTILNVAARKGDTRLATRIWTLMENAGYSATPSAYAAIVHAFGTKKDDLSMFGALLEMEQRGHTPVRALTRHPW